MPRVAAAVGLTDPFDPRQALPGLGAAAARAARALPQSRIAAAALRCRRPPRQRMTLHGGKLPRDATYVVRITSRSVDEWRKSPPGESACASRGRCHAASFRPSPAWSWSRNSRCRNSKRRHSRRRHSRRRPAGYNKPRPRNRDEQLHAAAAEPAPVGVALAARPHVRMTVRAEAVRKFAGVMHAGMRAGWAVPLSDSELGRQRTDQRTRDVARSFPTAADEQSHPAISTAAGAKPVLMCGVLRAEPENYAAYRTPRFVASRRRRFAGSSLRIGIIPDAVRSPGDDACSGCPASATRQRPRAFSALR